MKVRFWCSRRVVVPTEDTYKPVTYEHGTMVEYSHEETKDFTIIAENEFKTMEKLIDSEQRKIIKDEMGITELPMDKLIVKENKKFKFKFKNK